MALKRTLLEIVQDILVSLDGDEVTDIASTTESLSVANIVKQVYFSLFNEFDIPSLRDVVSLEEDVTAPVLFTPNTLSVTIDTVKYNVGTATLPKYQDVHFMANEEFFQRQLLLSPIDGVENASFAYSAVAGSSVPIPYNRKKDPLFFTTLKDGRLLFDSYNSDTSARLTEANTFAFGAFEVTWSQTNSFVPPVNAKMHELLFQQAKEQAFNDLKQVENASAVRGRKRARVAARNDPDALGNRDKYYDERYLPNYGRR